MNMDHRVGIDCGTGSGGSGQVRGKQLGGGQEIVTTVIEHNNK